MNRRISVVSIALLWVVACVSRPSGEGSGSTAGSETPPTSSEGEATTSQPSVSSTSTGAADSGSTGTWTTGSASDSSGDSTGYSLPKFDVPWDDLPWPHTPSCMDCDPLTEYCCEEYLFHFGPPYKPIPTQTCKPVPTECQDDVTCECLASVSIEGDLPHCGVWDDYDVVDIGECDQLPR